LSQKKKLNCYIAGNEVPLAKFTVSEAEPVGLRVNLTLRLPLHMERESHNFRISLKEFTVSEAEPVGFRNTCSPPVFRRGVPPEAGRGGSIGK